MWNIFQESPSEASIAPPFIPQPVTSSDSTITEHIIEWSKWALYHTGISNHRPYENLPIPSPIAIPNSAKIRCFSCHPHKDQIAIALRDHSVHIYELKNGKWSPDLVLTHQFQKNITCIEWKPLSGSTLAIGCQTGVLIWEGDWMTRYFSTPSVSNISSIQWSPFESLLAIGSPHESVIIWDVATEIPIRLNGLPPNSSYLLKWSPNGHYLFQASLFVFVFIYFFVVFFF